MDGVRAMWEDRDNDARRKVGDYYLRVNQDWSAEWLGENCDDWMWFCTASDDDEIRHMGRLKAASLQEAKVKAVDALMSSLCDNITDTYILLYALIAEDWEEKDEM